MRNGLQDLDINELIGDFDPDNLPILGEDALLESQAKEQQDKLNQVSKDGVASRIKDIKDEMNSAIIAEKGKQAARELGIQGAQAASQLLQGIFGESKAIATAETLVSTYFAAQKAYESQMLIPSPDALIRAKVAAGIAIAQGLARVAAIQKTNASGGGGRGGVSGGGGANVGGSSQNQQQRGFFETNYNSSFQNQSVDRFSPARPESMGATIVLQGSLDEEVMAYKVKSGNAKIESGTTYLGD